MSLRPTTPADDPPPDEGPIAADARRRAEAAAKLAAQQVEYRLRVIEPAAVIRREWEAAWTGLWESLSPVWFPWEVARRRRQGLPALATRASTVADSVAVKAAVLRACRAIAQHDEFRVRLDGAETVDAYGRPATVVGRLRLMVRLRAEFDNPFVWVMPSLLLTGIDATNSLLADEVRAVLGSPDYRNGLGLTLYLADCLWSVDTYREPRDVLTAYDGTDPAVAWSMNDDHRVRSVLRLGWSPTADAFRAWPTRADQTRIRWPDHAEAADAEPGEPEPPAVAPPGDGIGGGEDGGAIRRSGALLSAAGLREEIGLTPPLYAVENHLRKLRTTLPKCFIEIDPAARDTRGPQYLYHLSQVESPLREWAAGFKPRKSRVGGKSRVNGRLMDGK